MERFNGVVKWFNSAKGFGFLIQDDGTEHFAHYSQIQVDGDEFRNLEEGQTVTFEVEETDKGTQANNIEVV